MNEVWFSSDQHFGHANIIGFCDRGFNFPDYPYDPDVDAMNETLVERWNASVSPNDTIIVVGDFALGARENVVKFGKRLLGNKVLVVGNHDRCWTGNAKGYKNFDLYFEAGFSTITTQMLFEGYLVNHFPYENDSRFDDKFSGFRPSRKDWQRPLIHGHVHDAWKVRDDMINVGVDVWGFAPVNFETVRKELPL